MRSKYVIDAYAWIEYFRASKYGKVAKEYIENTRFSHTKYCCFRSQSKTARRNRTWKRDS